VRRSLFIATADRTASVEEARALIASMRAEFPEAGHHPYAFVVGHGATVTQGAGDDGEPQGTAGPPILAVLSGSGLGDVCLVVSRIYGGVKLGTGGLVRAYSGAAQAVLADLATEVHRQWMAYRVRVPYGLLDQVQRALECPSVVVESRVFEREVILSLRVDRAHEAEVAALLADLSGGAIALEEANAGGPARP
jgi:uncharacterized YigZ family protein